MNVWMEMKLIDFMQFNPNETLSKGTVAKKVAMEYLMPFNKKVQGYIDAPFNGGTKFKNGDTLLARITPCLENGKTAYVDFLSKNEVAFGSTEYIVLREINGVSNSKFIFYLATSGEFRDTAIQLMTGTSGRQRVETDAFKERIFTVPPLPEQETIAEVLSSLDDKIDLLNRQNKTLEALAETYFRQWFIEDAKADWEEKGLDEIAEFLNGLPLQKYSYKSGEYLRAIKIKELNNGFSDSSDMCNDKVPSRYIINNGDIVFSWSGSLALDYWKFGKGALNQHLFKVTPNGLPAWFCYHWIKFYLTEFRGIAEDKATTMGHIQRHHLTDAKVAVPSKDELEHMDKIIQPITEKGLTNNTQIQTLQSLRDTLLPKLISGEVSV